MKLSNIILNKTIDQNGNSVLPKRAIKIKPEFFKKMYTYKKGTDSINKGALIDRCANLWLKHLSNNLDVNISELYLDRTTLKYVDTDNRVVSEISESELSEIDIEQVAASRGIAKISVPGLIDGFSPAIAINMNEKGDEFAWGNNVHICSNLTILRAENIQSTYRKAKGVNGGHKKPKIEDILTYFEQFMKETKRNFDKEIKQIEEWKNKQISRQDFHQFLGKQYSKIQVVNHYRIKRKIKELEDKYLPINGLQLSKIAIEADKPSYKEYKWNGEKTSIWNLINYGTEVIKFQNGSDSTTILQANNNWVKLVNEFDFQTS